MTPQNDPPEMEIIPSLVSDVIELLDPEKVIAVDINELLETIINFIFREKKIVIRGFQLSRAESSIPVYLPGAFPIGFTPIKTLRDLTTVTPLILLATFEITHSISSRIKAKGLGELTIYKEKGKILVQARDIWHIEEVMEASPSEEKEKMAEKLEGFIKKTLIAFLARLLAELATKALTGK